MESVVMTEEFSMDELLGEATAAAQPGNIVEGTVVGLTDSHVLVNVGLKQEAALPLKEFGANLPVMPALGPGTHASSRRARHKSWIACLCPALW